MEREKRELNKWKITAIVVMFLLLAVSILYALQRDQNKMVTEKTAVSTEPSSKKGSDEVNYADAGSWLFFADGARKDVDLFLIAPTVETVTAIIPMTSASSVPGVASTVPIADK